jgi:hypothetical protein
MTWFAEMSRAKAEPQSEWAAELALKVDVVGSVFIALSNSSARSDRRATCTNQLFRFELFFLFFLIILLPARQTVSALFQASKVRRLALETNVVGAFFHSEFLKVVIEEVIDVLQPRTLVKPFVFSSFKRFLSYYFFHCLTLEKKLLKFGTLGETHKFLAFWFPDRTIKIGKHDPGSQPFLFNKFCYAIKVEDMLAPV